MSKGGGKLNVDLSLYMFRNVRIEVVLMMDLLLGNLTRCEPVIESLCHNRASEALVLLLVHANFDILLAVTGAFINISAHPSGLITLASSEQPIQSLAQILRKSSFKNLQLTTLVCQVCTVLYTVVSYLSPLSYFRCFTI